MSRAEFLSPPRTRLVAMLAGLLLAACGSTPPTVEPPLRKQALQAESDGARHYARGDYGSAARHFGSASQLRTSLDDPVAAARNRLHQGRAELAGGQAQAALGRAQHSVDSELALDARLLEAQANLALARPLETRAALAAAAALCAANCAQAASLNLLQARAALAEGRAAIALGHAESALKLLQGQDEAYETGNAWRLVAAARLALEDPSGALPAARAALDIDRQLALPEKIARDWLLIGDCERKVGAGATASPASRHAAALAYRRARDVANAAGLDAIAAMATRSLVASGDATAIDMTPQ